MINKEINEVKTILITGATSGIGYATAIKAAQQHWTVILNGRDEVRLLNMRKEFEMLYGSTVHTIAYDVTDIEAVKRSFLWIKKNVGQLDVLVNNAGIMDDALIGMLKPEQLQKTLEVNTSAAIYHMQFALRVMARQKRGSIINVSSIIGRFGNAGQIAYSASKAALIGATYSAAKELASLNIRVNAIAPGFIETDLTKYYSDKLKQQTLGQIKMGRAGSAEEVANVILFLASDAASYVTGQVIGVDGGMVI
ncbi:MAG: SDR family NAD(P)-dependent oxidoreductase [Solibacillus sp.]|uniref:SDR family NAD(P)-dependent oxidoreductase n=1 Tax=Solibacillus sp. TaxID=1909654 RepID=UPI003315567C